MCVPQPRPRATSSARNTIIGTSPAAISAYCPYSKRRSKRTAASTASEPAPQLDALPSSRTRGCLTTKIATDETVMDEPVRAALRGMLAGLEALLEERLSQPDARARLELPPKDAARLLLTFTRGNVVMERIYHGPKELQATAKSMIQILFKRC